MHWVLGSVLITRGPGVFDERNHIRHMIARTNIPRHLRSTCCSLKSIKRWRVPTPTSYCFSNRCMTRGCEASLKTWRAPQFVIFHASWEWFVWETWANLAASYIRPNIRDIFAKWMNWLTQSASPWWFPPIAWRHDWTTVLCKQGTQSLATNQSATGFISHQLSTNYDYIHVFRPMENVIDRLSK